MPILQPKANTSRPIPAPPFRRLRIYAFDPSVALRLDTAVINLVTVQVPWERAEGRGMGTGSGTTAEPIAADRSRVDFLDTGPVGEYLEIVDYDPASDCFYAPVDLNDPSILAQDGLPPSEGNPQFHQQMVYAVAMTTIRHFERALGRVALWAPRYDASKRKGQRDAYVRRLRIYPHALREANAYYSPEKKALLFGYFPAPTSDPGHHLPGGMVFTCLSHDIVAHETAHALLDGMHRRFIEPSNPDVLAFHEAFADIVALFQHFTYAEVLRHQIARTRGDLSTENLLAQLAQQFGQATGQHGALRDALGGFDRDAERWVAREPDPNEITHTFEPHARGAILVAALFDAFVAIYQSRTADLLRIATQGTGILPAGALHPDLVKRLADEAAKSAQHLLTMCIRALDYCPPVDITFGEYLRALITSDYDLVPDDDLGYRIAVVEAFRRRGIYPRDVRSLSVESVRWQPPPEENQQRFRQIFVNPDSLAELCADWNISASREHIYHRVKRASSHLHRLLNVHLQDEALRLQMGLSLESEGFEVHTVRPARRIGPDGQYLVEMVIEVMQRRPEFIIPEGKRESQDQRAPAEPDFYFRGGCTLLVDLDSGHVRYCIAKNINSAQRLDRQRRYMGGEFDRSLQAVYFHRTAQDDDREPFALLHRSHDELAALARAEAATQPQQGS